MIPKKIHYCWFGGNTLPESAEKCLASWRKYCPDYEIIQWNESNYDITKIPYVKEAYDAKMYAFVSDYARLDIIYSQGGIYLDTDVELVKSLDKFLNHECYMGMEMVGTVSTGLGFGAVPGAHFLLKNMETYRGVHFSNNGRLNKTTCLDYTFRALEGEGFRRESTIQKLKNIVIYPPDFFSPRSMETGIVHKTENTHSIHWGEASWTGGNQLSRKVRKLTLPLKIKFSRYIDQVFGQGSYKKFVAKVKRYE